MDTPLTVKSEKPAKSTYVNGDLPFENYRRDLKDWQHKFIPDLCDWAGTIDEPFTANAHPEFTDVVETLWTKYFPTAGVANEAVPFMQYFTLLHEFRRISPESHGMLEFHWESAGMVGMCHSCGFLWIPSGIQVEFPWKFHPNSRMIPSGI